MDPDGSIQIVAFIVCIFLSALFSASETAFLSVNRIRMSNKADEGSVSARRVMRLLDDKDRLITTILVGNNIVNLSASSISTAFAIQYFGSTAVGIATGIVTLLVLVFGEITPKTLATRHADGMTAFFAPALRFLEIVLFPVVFCLNAISGLFVRLSGKKGGEEVSFTENELITMVNISHEQGELKDEEKSMLQNVFTFGDDVVRKVMTPRVNVVTVDIEWTYSEIMDVFREHQFSRVPVYEESPDHIVGLLNIKDIAFADVNDKTFDIRKFIREPMVCYEFNQIKGVFDRMRRDRVGLAIACDEYGIMTGIVSMEDLIEEIVGDITDEYDEEEEPLIKLLPDGSYVMDGSVSIELFNEMVGSSIGEDSSFDSIGGYVLGLINDVPEEGQSVEEPEEGIAFTIQTVDNNRISQLSVRYEKPERQDENEKDSGRREKDKENGRDKAKESLKESAERLREGNTVRGMAYRKA